MPSLPLPLPLVGVTFRTRTRLRNVAHHFAIPELKQVAVCHGEDGRYESMRHVGEVQGVAKVHKERLIYSSNKKNKTRTDDIYRHYEKVERLVASESLII